MGSLKQLLPVLFLIAAPGLADDPDLVTDRPDQTESAVSVPPGFVQLEIGALIGDDDEGGVSVEFREVGSTLVRVGLFEGTELRVGWSGFVEETVKTAGARAKSDGVGDASLGFKTELLDERGRRPRVAILAATSLPLGDSDVTSDRFDPSARLSFSHTLSDRVGLGYNAGVELATGFDEAGLEHTLSSAIYTVALGVGLSDRTGAFFELFGDLPLSAPGGATHSFDAGITYLLRPNLQLDVAVGVGLSEDAADTFAGVGVSWRWPR